jgi:hypothetical protein
VPFAASMCASGKRFLDEDPSFYLGKKNIPTPIRSKTAKKKRLRIKKFKKK